jgi:hypothetical protein
MVGSFGPFNTIKLKIRLLPSKAKIIRFLKFLTLFLVITRTPTTYAFGQSIKKDKGEQGFCLSQYGNFTALEGYPNKE